MSSGGLAGRIVVQGREQVGELWLSGEGLVVKSHQSHQSQGQSQGQSGIARNVVSLPLRAVQNVEEVGSAQVRVMSTDSDAAQPFFFCFAEPGGEAAVHTTRTWAATHSVTYTQRWLHPSSPGKPVGSDQRQLSPPSSSGLTLPNLDDPIVRQFVLQLLFSDRFHAFVHDMEGLIQGMGWTLSFAPPPMNAKQQQEQQEQQPQQEQQQQQSPSVVQHANGEHMSAPPTSPRPASPTISIDFSDI